MTIPLIYVSAPYTDADPQRIASNILEACALGREILAGGHAVPLVPHIAVLPPEGSPESIWGAAMHQCLAQLAKCDGAIFHPNWQKSKGCRVEMANALAWGIPVYLSMDELHQGVGAMA